MTKRIRLLQRKKTTEKHVWLLTIRHYFVSKSYPPSPDNKMLGHSSVFQLKQVKRVSSINMMSEEK